MNSTSMTFVTSPFSMKTMVSITWGIIPRSTLPISLWRASMGLLAWTTPIIPTPAILRSAKTWKSFVFLTSS